MFIYSRGACVSVSNMFIYLFIYLFIYCVFDFYRLSKSIAPRPNPSVRVISANRPRICAEAGEGVTRIIVVWIINENYINFKKKIILVSSCFPVRNHWVFIRTYGRDRRLLIHNEVNGKLKWAGKNLDKK